MQHANVGGWGRPEKRRTLLINSGVVSASKYNVE